MKNNKGRHIEDGADVEMDEEALIRGIQKDYEFSLQSQQKYIDIMIELSLEHDNAIDPDEFPTRTKSSAALKFAQTEEQLAFALPYLWPPFNPVRIMPRTEEGAIEAARKVERGVYAMAKYDMEGERTSLPIIRDCAKVGLGYGIVEPYTYSPLDAFDITAENEEGEVIATSKEMDVGEPVRSLRLRYITPGQVVPYPDGCEPNGPCRSSKIFFWDFASEHEFRNMVSEDSIEGLDFDVEKLNDEAVGDIIAKAKTGSIQFAGKTFANIKALGGIDYTKLTSADRSAEATIPILKVYKEGEHVWLANGETIIYRQAARAQTVRCPLLKMSAVRDGMTWFPFTTTEAMRGSNFQKNVWMNLVTDLVVWSAKRPFIYSHDAFEDGKPPEFGPDSSVGVSGSVRDGAAFLSPPNIDAGTLAVGDKLDALSDQVSGRKDYTQKNFTRGGQNAFNDLLNSSEGRQRIAGAVMESGFMTDYYTQVMIYMQIEMRGYKRIISEHDEESGEDRTTAVTVTPEDFAHAYSLSISFDRHKFAAEFSVTDRIALYQQMNDGTWDEYEKKRFLLGNDELLHQMSKGKKETADIAAENRALEQESMMQGGGGAPGGGALPPGLAGAALGGAPGAEAGAAGGMV